MYQVSSTVSSASLQASELTGLPQDVLTTLIEMEGTLPGGSNNPFDVTKDWANLVNYGGSVTGLWNTNPGVAIFSSTNDAINAWADGLKQFSVYAQFRVDAANPSSTIYTLFKDLQDAGYAGDNTSYAANLANLYQQITGKSAYTTTLAGNTMPANTAITSTTASTTQVSANSGVSGTPSTLGTITYTFTNGILHLGIAFMLLILALAAIFFGLYILVNTDVKEEGKDLLADG